MEQEAQLPKQLCKFLSFLLQIVRPTKSANISTAFGSSVKDVLTVTAAEKKVIDIAVASVV